MKYNSEKTICFEKKEGIMINIIFFLILIIDIIFKVAIYIEYHLNQLVITTTIVDFSILFATYFYFLYFSKENKKNFNCFLINIFFLFIGMVIFNLLFQFFTI